MIHQKSLIYKNMKHLVRTLVIASLMMLVMNSCIAPVTQEGKIEKVARAYIEQGLKDGESIRWGGCGIRLHIDVDGKKCTYTEVKYILTTNGSEVPKTLYLLLSENCDELYAATDKKSGDTQDPVWKAVDEALNQSVKDAEKEINNALKEIGF